MNQEVPPLISTPANEMNDLGENNINNSNNSGNNSSNVFSESDIDLLVRLVLAGEWDNVEFYFNFLISHYQKYSDVSSTYHNRTSHIIHSLYELMVNVKIQKYFEALEGYVLSSCPITLTHIYVTN